MFGILPKKVAEKVDFTNHCWLWNGRKNASGYGVFVSEGKMISTHRLSWECFNGDIPDGLFVLHTCDVRNCVNPAHLFLGTHQDNMADMVAKGRGNKPSGDPRVGTKLTLDQQNEIYALYRRGENGRFFSRADLANRFNITEDRVGRLVKRSAV